MFDIAKSPASVRHTRRTPASRTLPAAALAIIATAAMLAFGSPLHAQTPPSGASGASGTSGASGASGTSGAASKKSQAQPELKFDAVVATVNGVNLTELDLAMAEIEIGEQLQQFPEQTRRRVLIEYLIENQIFASLAEKEKLQNDKKFKAKMIYWHRRMLRDTYFDQTIRARITDADARKFYEAKIKSVKTGPEIKARHILVKTEDKAKELYEKIAHGADFAELASKNSIDPGSKTDGGLLGYFTKGRMVKEFETAAFQLKIDEVSLPVKTQFGWHLIKVEDIRTPKPPSFESVKQQVYAALVRQRANEFMKKARADAKISVVGEPVQIGPKLAPAAPTSPKAK